MLPSGLGVEVEDGRWEEGGWAVKWESSADMEGGVGGFLPRHLMGHRLLVLLQVEGVWFRVSV